jgi:hypothetical protein
LLVAGRQPERLAVLDIQHDMHRRRPGCSPALNTQVAPSRSNQEPSGMNGD